MGGLAAHHCINSSTNFDLIKVQWCWRWCRYTDWTSDAVLDKWYFTDRSSVFLVCWRPTGMGFKLFSCLQMERIRFCYSTFVLLMVEISYNWLWGLFWERKLEIDSIVNTIRFPSSFRTIIEKLYISSSEQVQTFCA